MAFSQSVLAKEFSPNDYLEHVMYYFDTEGEQMLFEIIMEFKQRKVDDEMVKALYGRPNFMGDRWKLDVHEGFDMLVWEHELKLVVIGKNIHKD